MVLNEAHPRVSARPSRDFDVGLIEAHLRRLPQ
jgi:hypothetical protein